MGFGGLNFIFDGQYSENYGLQIMSINSNFVTDASGGCGIEIFKDSVYRNPTQYHQGIAQSQVLTFEIEFVSENEITGINRSKISKWLFGRMGYKKLRIVQPDLQDIYFNCHLIDPQLTYIGNHCHGIKCTVECDAPWAWQNQRTYRFIELANQGMTYVEPCYCRQYNDSDDTDYAYPIIEFKMNNSLIGNGVCSIINETDDAEREFRFEGLHANEVITVDCRKQMLFSSENRLVSECFNKVFMRLLPGANTLKLTGEFAYLHITYCNARKVGG